MTTTAQLPAGSGPATASSGARATGRAFAAVAVSLVVLMTGTNLPSPLYGSYRAAFGFSALTLTLVFATYAATLIVSLLVCGPLSDAVGRRRVLLPALALAGVASLVFAAAAGTAWLYVARAVQGLAVGAASGAAGAALADLEPSGDRKRAAVVAAAATVAGTAAGPLLAGVLAQYAPAPLVTVYVVHAVLVLAAVAGLGLLPRETRAGRYRPRRPEVPTQMRATFAVAGTSAFLAWAVTALFLALVPTLVAELGHTSNLAVAGAVAAIMLAASALAQFVTGRLTPVRGQAIGLTWLTAGLAALVLAAQFHLLIPLLAASVLAGIGHGLAFGAALSDVQAAAPADRAGGVLSAFFVVIYLGVGLPVIGVGLLAGLVGVAPAVEIFGGVVGLACLTSLPRLRRRGRRSAARPS